MQHGNQGYGTYGDRSYDSGSYGAGMNRTQYGNQGYGTVHGNASQWGNRSYAQGTYNSGNPNWTGPNPNYGVNPTGSTWQGSTTSGTSYGAGSSGYGTSGTTATTTTMGAAAGAGSGYAAGSTSNDNNNNNNNNTSGSRTTNNDSGAATDRARTTNDGTTTTTNNNGTTSNAGTTTSSGTYGATRTTATTTNGSAELGSIRSGVAVIRPTEGSSVAGTIRFSQTGGGLRVTADITGLQPNGRYGFHVHEFGDASSPTGDSVGDHFNPTGEQHGAPDAATRHAGDLGNLEADGTGRARYDRTLDNLSLGQKNAILGRSIVIHEKADDMATQPSGDSGRKIAVGVIGVGSDTTTNR
jgi:Cu-Zn family superoxide dismutase